MLHFLVFQEPVLHVLLIEHDPNGYQTNDNGGYRGTYCGNSDPSVHLAVFRWSCLKLKPYKKYCQCGNEYTYEHYHAR